MDLEYLYTPNQHHISTRPLKPKKVKKKKKKCVIFPLSSFFYKLQYFCVQIDNVLKIMQRETFKYMDSHLQGQTLKAGGNLHAEKQN